MTATVECPTCRAPVEWGPQSPNRPFCSERCKLIDLALAESPYAIMVSPLLVESGQYRQVGRVLVVDVPESLQIARTTARDQASEEQVRAILNAQVQREERLKHADDVLVNDRDLAWLGAEVERLHRFYLTLRGGQK